MSRTIPRLAAALALLILGESSWGQSKEAVVTGTVAYLQRSALPPDAVVNVQLQDVSLQDAPAKTIAEVKIPTGGKQVPIAFRIPYQAAEIDPAHSYAVRATITEGGNMMFTSTNSYSVITRDAPTEVSIIVQPVSTATAPDAGSGKATAQLEGTHWKLIELGGTPLVAAPGAEEANLTLSADEKRLAGSGGCNRLFGSYRLRKGSLRFKPAGMTMMACPDAVMRQEQALMETLRKTTGYRIVGRTLELLDGQQVLARFEGSDQP